MALTLDTRRRLPAALHSLLQRELDHAVRRLDQAAGPTPDDLVTGVHEFRRSVKRLRAALQLLDGAVTTGERTAIDELLGGAARRLGALRDSHARTLAAQRVVRLVPRSMRALAMDAWRSAGGAGVEASTRQGEAGVAGLLRRSRAEIEQARARVKALDLSKVDAALLSRAVSDAWARARDRFRSRWDGRDEAWLHGNRKRAQRAANLLLLMASAAGPWAVRTERRLRKATALLGEARDAELMVERMPEPEPGSPLRVPAQRLRTLARRHRATCLRAARAQGVAAMREGRGPVRRRLRKALDPAR